MAKKKKAPKEVVTAMGSKIQIIGPAGFGEALAKRIKAELTKDNKKRSPK